MCAAKADVVLYSREPARELLFSLHGCFRRLPRMFSVRGFVLSGREGEREEEGAGNYSPAINVAISRIVCTSMRFLVSTLSVIGLLLFCLTFLCPEGRADQNFSTMTARGKRRERLYVDDSTSWPRRVTSGTTARVCGTAGPLRWIGMACHVPRSTVLDASLCKPSRLRPLTDSTTSPTPSQLSFRPRHLRSAPSSTHPTPFPCHHASMI